MATSDLLAGAHLRWTLISAAARAASPALRTRLSGGQASASAAAEAAAALSHLSRGLWRAQSCPRSRSSRTLTTSAGSASPCSSSSTTSRPMSRRALPLPPPRRCRTRRPRMTHTHHDAPAHPRASAKLCLLAACARLCRRSARPLLSQRCRWTHGMSARSRRPSSSARIRPAPRARRSN